jgi:hypothetical protein
MGVLTVNEKIKNLLLGELKSMLSSNAKNDQLQKWLAVQTFSSTNYSWLPCS